MEDSAFDSFLFELWSFIVKDIDIDIDVDIGFVLLSMHLIINFVLDIST